MPLSDREQQLLEQLERALADDDPKFASQMRGDGSRGRRAYLAIAAVGLVAGLALVLLAVNVRQIWLGAVGFAVMVAGVGYAVTPHRPRPKDIAAPGRPSPRPSRKQASFMERLEGRWDHRRGGDGHW